MFQQAPPYHSLALSASHSGSPTPHPFNATLRHVLLPGKGSTPPSMPPPCPSHPFNRSLARPFLKFTPWTPLQSVRTHFGGYLEMPAINDACQGRPHRYVYAYRSEFDDPQIGVAKVSWRQPAASATLAQLAAYCCWRS